MKDVFPLSKKEIKKRLRDLKKHLHDQHIADLNSDNPARRMLALTENIIDSKARKKKQWMIVIALLVVAIITASLWFMFNGALGNIIHR